MKIKNGDFTEYGNKKKIEDNHDDDIHDGTNKTTVTTIKQYE